VPLAYGIEYVARYYNENDLIPGVELKVVNYDTKYDPARDIPGYEWVRERGAQIIITPLSSTAEVLKPFLERDQVVLFSCASTPTLVEDPGWIFCKDPPQSAWIKALLKWISEEHWDYESEGRKPKVGAAGWLEYTHMDIDEGIK
jgi:ABC-type branched-subunit amino acid transport system substrate-binding protein